MNKDLVDNLWKKFPLLYNNVLGGFSVEDGWYDLLYNLSDKLTKELNDNPIEGFCVECVKEKFAGLRYYVSHYTDNIIVLINETEDLSRVTCEFCGKPGEMTDYKKCGWVKTCCPIHKDWWELGRKGDNIP